MPRRREASLRSSSSTPHLINQPSSLTTSQLPQSDSIHLSDSPVGIPSHSVVHNDTTQPRRRPRRTSSAPTLNPSPLSPSPSSFSPSHSQYETTSVIDQIPSTISPSTSSLLTPKPQFSNPPSLFLPPHYGRPSSRPSSPLVLSSVSLPFFPPFSHLQLTSLSLSLSG